MPKTKCESCGKYYDLLDSETCPKCGAYNKTPASSGAFRQEKPIPGPRRFQIPQGDLKKAQPEREQGRRQVPPVPRRTARRSPIQSLVSFAILLAVFFLTSQFAGKVSPSETASLPTDQQWLTHQFGEVFSIGYGIDVQITGGGVFFEEDGLPGLPRGKMCIYLDVTVTGGSGEYAAKAELSEPYLWCEEEGYLSPETGGVELLNGLKEFGVSPVEFADLRKQDPLNGQIVFLVSEESSEFTFGLEERNAQSGATYLHELYFYIE